MNCCKFCVPPKRKGGCHDKCDEYQEEKTEREYMLSHKRLEVDCYVTTNRKRSRASYAARTNRLEI